MDSKVKALAKHLDCNIEDIDVVYDEYLFGREGYCVLLDEEADEAVYEYIKKLCGVLNHRFLLLIQK